LRRSATVRVAGDEGWIDFEISYRDEMTADDSGYVWIDCSCACRIGCFRGRFPLQLTDDDAQRLFDALVAVSKGPPAEASIDNMEDDYTLSFRATKTGAVVVKGQLHPRSGVFVTLDFTISSDLQTLAAAAESLAPVIANLRQGGRREAHRNR
jgi:hypothetical protein